MEKSTLDRYVFVILIESSLSNLSPLCIRLSFRRQMSLSFFHAVVRTLQKVCNLKSVLGYGCTITSMAKINDFWIFFHNTLFEINHFKKWLVLPRQIRDILNTFLRILVHRANERTTSAAAKLWQLFTTLELRVSWGC